MKHLYLKKIEIDNENLSPSPPPLPSREGKKFGEPHQGRGTHSYTPLKRGFSLSPCGRAFLPIFLSPCGRGLG
jgi:hypothetical protein